MAPTKGAFSTLVTTDTGAASLVVGGATGGATTGTGRINAGSAVFSAGLALDGGTISTHGIVMPTGVPAVTTMALYNDAGTLKWNGTTLAAGSSVSGTTGTIGKFTASNAVGDSIITESGSTIAVAGTVNVTTAYQIGGFSLNTLNTLTNVAYLDGSNVFTSASGQKFTGGISVSAGTQSTAGIMIPSAVPAVTTTCLYNTGATLTWPGAAALIKVGTSTDYFEAGAGGNFSSVTTTTSGTWSGAQMNLDIAGGAGVQSFLNFGRYRGVTIAGATIVLANDELGKVVYKGFDGSSLTAAASIVAAVDGTPGVGDMPGRLMFNTTPDGTGVVVERMRITNAGNIGIGTTTASARLHVISTTEQVRTGYDSSNYFSTTVGSTGAVTFAATGAGAAFAFSQTVTATLSGNVTGDLTGNVTGNCSGTAATVTGAAQAAITSLGTLTTLTLAGPRLMTGVISPTQLTGNTDNWNPTGLATANVIRMDVDAPRTITGIVAQASGTILILYNKTNFTITLAHDATSTAANRFYCTGNVDMGILAHGTVEARYDGTDSRWCVYSRT